MEVQVAETGPCRRTVTVTLPAERIRNHLDHAYQQTAQHVQMKGFRAGKVPRKVLESRFGDAIARDAKEALINQSFREACSEKDLTPIGRPQWEGVDDSPLDGSNPLEYTVHVDVRPEFELARTAGIEVAAQPTAVTDEDVEQALGQLADQKKTLDPIDEPVAEGDFVKGDLVFQDDDGNEVAKREGAQLNTNIPLAGVAPEDFGPRLVGAEKGTKIEYALTFPDNFETEDVRGKTGTVQLSILDVLRVQPAPIDDELAKGFEFDDLDSLKSDLTKRIEFEKERQEKARQEQFLLDTLLAENTFEIPDAFVEDQTNAGIEQFRAQLKQQQVPDDDAEQRVEQAKEEIREDATRRVRMFFLIDAVARTEKLVITDEDVLVELRNIAAQNNVTLEQVEEYYRENNLTTELRLGLLESKVRNHLRENAKISDNS